MTRPSTSSPARSSKQPELSIACSTRSICASLRNRALLFLPPEQIRQIQDNLPDMNCSSKPPVLGGSIRFSAGNRST